MTSLVSTSKSNLSSNSVTLLRSLMLLRHPWYCITRLMLRRMGKPRLVCIPFFICSQVERKLESLGSDCPQHFLIKLIIFAPFWQSWVALVLGNSLNLTRTHLPHLSIEGREEIASKLPLNSKECIIPCK